MPDKTTPAEWQGDQRAQKEQANGAVESWLSEGRVHFFGVICLSSLNFCKPLDGPTFCMV
jgi:hypothetical protein